jgi:hypothetical protein
MKMVQSCDGDDVFCSVCTVLPSESLLDRMSSVLGLPHDGQ